MVIIIMNLFFSHLEGHSNSYKTNNNFESSSQEDLVLITFGELIQK